MNIHQNDQALSLSEIYDTDLISSQTITARLSCVQYVASVCASVNELMKLLNSDSLSCSSMNIFTLLDVYWVQLSLETMHLTLQTELINHQISWFLEATGGEFFVSFRNSLCLGTTRCFVSRGPWSTTIL